MNCKYTPASQAKRVISYVANASINCGKYAETTLEDIAPVEATTHTPVRSFGVSKGVFSRYERAETRPPASDGQAVETYK